MALTVDTPVVQVLGNKEQYPVLADEVIFEGSMVSASTTGYAKNLAGGETFLGHSLLKKQDATGKVDGDESVQVLTGVYSLEVGFSGAVITDVGSEIYASDNNTLTKTSSGNTLVGKIVRYVNANTVVVRFSTI